MNRPDHRLLPLFAAAALAAAVGAQDLPNTIATPTGQHVQPQRTPIHTQAHDGGTAYGTWAAGRDYKASFHDGATFVPFLGRDYPRTQSLHWRTVSARVGELELATHTPRLTHGDFRAEYDLGGIVEAYDVRAEGLEQTFVLAQRPGAGDLVIEGAITTALRAERTAPGHTEVVFADAGGRRILRYGAATAIDANGRTLPMTTTMGDGSLTLRLDGEWLATAAFPVVVDPLLAVFVSSGGVALEGIDLAREHSLNAGNLWLATSRWVSATDSDLWLVRYDDDGGNGTINFTDLTASWSSTEPSLGMHFTAGKALLAFTRESITGTRRIRFHLHSRNDNLLQTHVLNLGDLSINAWRPDVATDLHPIGQNALVVVYQAEGTGFPFTDLLNSSVFGCAVDLAGNGTAGVPFAIASNLGLDHERPQIGKVQLGSQQVWTVAYQVIDSGLVPGGAHPDWDIAVRRVDRNGNVGAATLLTTPGTAIHQMAPRLAGFNGTQLVAWTASVVGAAGARPTGANGHYIAARRIDWDGTRIVLAASTQYLQADQDARLVTTGFDVDRNTASHYGLTFRSTVTQNVYLRVLGYNGDEVQRATVFTPTGSESTGAGAVAFDEDGDDFVLAFERTQAGGSSAARLVRYAQPAVAAPTLGGIGCGTGQIAWQGSQLIGSEFGRVTLDNVAPGAIMAVAIATAPFSTPLLGVPGVQNGCWLLVPNAGPEHLGFFPLAFGPSSSWTLPLPEWLPGLTLYFQGFHFDGGNTAVFTTQRLAVPFAK